jgi:hypothetical protein
MSNVKQVGFGAAIYAGDYDDIGPCATDLDLYNTWRKADRISQSTTVYSFMALLVSPNKYVSVKMLECPSRGSKYETEWTTSYTSLFKKTTSRNVMSSYQIKPTALKSYAEMFGNPASWSYRFGRAPGSALVADVPFNGNEFSHDDGINVGYEDGSVKWLINVPKKVPAFHGSYTLSNGDARLTFYKQISRDGIWGQ